MPWGTTCSIFAGHRGVIQWYGGRPTAHPKRKTPMKLENMSPAITSGTSASTVSAPNARGDALRTGVLVEVVTIVWMVIEAIVAIGAGVLAGSLLLVAFGIDSIIELVTGGALLWRLTTEERGGSLERVERAENRAAWITGVGLVLLCIYVVVSAVTGV